MVLLVRRCPSLVTTFALSLAGNFFFFVFFAWPAFFSQRKPKPANDTEQTTAATDKQKQKSAN
jgi:hypothetical protein